jgi:hypothetical protein
VPGRGAIRYAGLVRIAPDGTVASATPGDRCLVEPDFDVTRVLCEALS